MGTKLKSKYSSKEYIGKKYGMLTITKEAVCEKPGVYVFEALCDCGNITKVREGNLLNGHTTSCRCFRKAVGKRNVKHGGCGKRIYHIWDCIVERCTKGTIASKHYAARGISICEDWKSFAKFEEWAYQNGYDDTLSIERIDVNGNYCPENCKWIPRRLQTRNQTTTHWVEYNGRRMSLAEACEIANMSYKTVHARITQLGWSVEEALTVPIGHYGSGRKAVKARRKHEQFI